MVAIGLLWWLLMFIVPVSIVYGIIEGTECSYYRAAVRVVGSRSSRLRTVGRRGNGVVAIGLLWQLLTFVLHDEPRSVGRLRHWITVYPSEQISVDGSTL